MLFVPSGGKQVLGKPGLRAGQKPFPFLRQHVRPSCWADHQPSGVDAVALGCQLGPCG